MELLVLYLKGVQTKPSGVRLTSTSSLRDQRQDMEVGPNLHRFILIVFVHSFIRSLISYGNLRSLRPAQTLVEELLECLTAEELQDVTENTQEPEHEHVHFSSKIPIPVKEHHLRYAMHQMNMAFRQDRVSTNSGQFAR